MPEALILVFKRLSTMVIGYIRKPRKDQNLVINNTATTATLQKIFFFSNM